MIHLTRLNSQPLVVNSDLIKFVESAHDTVLTLLSGEKVVVREQPDEVIRRIIAFRRTVIAGLPTGIHSEEMGEPLPNPEAVGPDSSQESNRRG